MSHCIPEVSPRQPYMDGHFYKVSKPWRDLGYTVIPSNGPTSKEPLKGVPWAHWCGEGRRAVPEAVYIDWCRRYAYREGLLLLNSSTGGLPDLAVIDIDDLTQLEWVEENWTDSPARVSSGRVGGGVHLYTQLPPGVTVAGVNQQFGPASSWTQDTMGVWRAKIDLKANRNYVVASGSNHKSGLVYTATFPITAESIRNLPVFDVPTYEKLKGRDKPTSTRTATSSPVGSGRRQTKNGATIQYEDFSKVTVPGNGQTLEQFAGGIPLGSSRRCGCPFHASDSGRSLQVSRRVDGSLTAFCHVETLSFRDERVKPLPPIGDRDDAVDLDAAYRFAKFVTLDEAKLSGVSEMGELLLVNTPTSNSPISLGLLDYEAFDVEESGSTTEAASRFDAEGGRSASCLRTTASLYIRGSTMEGKSLPCGTRCCPRCAPSLIRALASAAGAHFKFITDNGLTVDKVDRELSSKELERVVAPWLKQAPGERSYLIIPKSDLPGHVSTYFIGGVPPALASEAVPLLTGADDEVADTIRGQAVASWRGKTRALRGHAPLVKIIILIRDFLLGKRKARKSANPTPDAGPQEGVYLMTPKGFTDSVSAFIEAGVAITGNTFEGGKLPTAVGQWHATDGTNLEEVAHDLVASGRIKVWRKTARPTPTGVDVVTKEASITNLDALLNMDELG